MSILFSVIVPVYNVERYLPDCFKSLSKQSFQNFEVLLVDDGSTDSSGALCDEYQKMDGRFRAFHQPNGGLSAARNTGIRKASGDYLLFLDSDDFLVGADALEKLAVALKPAPDVLIYRITEWNEDASTVLSESPTRFEEKKLFRAEEILDSLYTTDDGAYVTMAQTKIVRREFCLQNQLLFLEGIYHEDDEWIARLLSASPTVAFSSAAVYGYRHREGSIITSAEEKKAVKRIEDRLTIGSIMLHSETAKTHPVVCLYAIRYFWGALCQIRSFSPDSQKKLLKKAKSHASAFRCFRYSKNRKWRICAGFERIFGIRATVRFFSWISHNKKEILK